MSEASRLIRDSIAALPRGRDPWWVDSDGDVVSGTFGPDVESDEDHGGYVIASEWAGATLPDEAAHIVLLASPDVAAAVADLLDAAHEYAEHIVGSDLRQPVSAELAFTMGKVAGAFLRLEETLTRRAGA